MPYKLIDKHCANPQCDYYGPIRKDTQYCGVDCYKSWRKLDKLRYLDSIVPSFSVELVVEGDCMLGNDWHMPYTDPDMYRYFIAIAEKFGIKQCALGGDVGNADGLSKTYPRNGIYDVPLNVELPATEKLFENLLDTFDVIYCCLGNHDERILKALDGTIDGQHLAKLYLPTKYVHLLNERIFFSTQRYLEINSGGEKFRYTHPANYSRNAPTVERALAEKFNSNIVSTHGHLFALGFDRSGRHVVAQLGTMIDQSKVPYTNLVDTNHPNWNQAFGMIRDGHLYPFANGFTDWRFWLGNEICIEG